MWIILELQENCQLDRQMDSVVSEIKNAFGEKVEYFLPVHVETINNKRLVTSLFDGYVFVNIGKVKNAAKCIDSIRGSYIAGPMVSRGTYTAVSDEEILRYKSRLEDILYTWTPRREEEVVPKVGIFRNMVGTVKDVDLDKKEATVVFKTRSREVTTNIQLLNLLPKDEAET
jgi:transcription antitermination factor NusG